MRTLLYALLVTGLMVGTVQAGLINVDANDNHTGGARLTNETYEGAAVLGGSGDTWNGQSGGGNWILTGLSDADGNSTLVSVELSGFNDSWSYKSGANDNMPSVDVGGGVRDYVYEDLFGDYSYVKNATGTVTLSGLDSNTAYELIVYAHGDSDDQNGIIEITTGTVGGAPTVQSSGVWTGVHDLTKGLDYVRWDSVTPVSGKIEFTLTNAEDDYAAFNGLQIVPEPATLALLGLGGLGLLLRRKRN